MINETMLHHVAVNVSDVKAAKHFYGTVLGLQELERPNFDFDGAWYQIGQQQLHLIHDQTMKPKETTAINTRAAHFAIRVKDYHKGLAKLKQQNVPLVENPSSVSGFAQFFCADPDGNVIELHVDQKDL